MMQTGTWPLIAMEIPQIKKQVEEVKNGARTGEILGRNAKC